ncbi:hypothetical protein BH10PSE7_BH10PSE7_30140 [soil metagenome]
MPCVVTRSILRRTIVLAAPVSLPTAARAQNAFPDILAIPDIPPAVLIAIVAAIMVSLWAFVIIRKLVKSEHEARHRGRDLEIQLNRTEAALNADPHVLIIWQGRDGEPEQVVGDMRGTARVPAARHDLLQFAKWLDFPPMGARFRLKASYKIKPGLRAGTKTVLQAMKKYGLVLADNGSPWFFQGTSDTRWSAALIEELKGITASAFEAVDTSPLMVTRNSMRVKEPEANDPANESTELNPRGVSAAAIGYRKPQIGPTPY